MLYNFVEQLKYNVKKSTKNVEQQMLLELFRYFLLNSFFHHYVPNATAVKK